MEVVEVAVEVVLVKLCQHKSILFSGKNTCNDFASMDQNSEFLLGVRHFVVTAKLWDLHATHTNNTVS